MTVTIVSNGKLTMNIDQPNGKVQQAALQEFQEAIDLSRARVRRTDKGLVITIEDPMEEVRSE